VAKIDELTFGSIIVEGKKYGRDILIFADGMVTKRGGGFLMFGSHQIRKRQLEELSHGQPEVIIIGTGTDGAAHIAGEGESWAKASNVSLLVRPSYDAVIRLNELMEQNQKGCRFDSHNLLSHESILAWFLCNALSCISGVLFHMDK
jgi:hypothetical protein